MPAYTRLAWRLSREPALSPGRRAVLIAGAAYLASPIDLVPGVIPLAGQLDDAAVVLLAIRAALRGLPAERRATHLAAAGLTESDLDVDLRTVRDGAGWLARRAGQLTGRASKAVGRGLKRTAAAAIRQARRRE